MIKSFKVGRTLHSSGSKAPLPLLFLPNNNSATVLWFRKRVIVAVATYLWPNSCKSTVLTSQHFYTYFVASADYEHL